MGTLPPGIGFNEIEIPDRFGRVNEERENRKHMKPLLPKDLLASLERADDPDAKVRELIAKQWEKPSFRTQFFGLNQFSTALVSVVSVSMLTTVQMSHVMSS